MSLITLPQEHMPATTALLRAVFGTYAVPMTLASAAPAQQAPRAAQMEAALLGVDYVKLVLDGCQKLPVLTLVGPEGGVATLFLRWMREVIGVPVRHGLLSDAHRPSSAKGLVVMNGDPSDELLALLQSIQLTEHICFFPNNPKRHHDVEFYPALCLRCDTPPDPERFRTLHWVRLLSADAIGAEDMIIWMATLTREYNAFTSYLLRCGFHTRPTTPLWFHPDEYCEPDTTTEQHAA